MAHTTEPMTQGPIWKRITYFALPIFLGNLFQQMYNTADSLIVGNFLGKNALAAVSSTGSLIFMLIGFLSGIAIGAGVVISRYFGGNKLEEMSKAVHTTVAFGLVAGVVMTAVGVGLSPQILRWMDTPENVMYNSQLYLSIYLMGSLGSVMYNVCVGIMQAVGDSRHPLYYLIVSSVVNVVLDLFFIAVLGMGVDGAAWATIIAQYVSAIMCLWRLLRVKDNYRVELRKIRFHWDMLKRVVRFGLPSGVQNSIIAIANVVVQSNINHFGDAAMAGVGAYSKIEGFGFLPITSFTMAMTTFVGQNLGAGQIERTKRGARFGTITSVILAELIGVAVFIFAPQLIAAFDTSPDVIAYGVDKARTSVLFYCLLAFSHAMASILRGAGKAVVPMFVMMICWCIIRVSFLAIAVPLTGSIQMVYWVYPLTWFLSSVTFLWYYRRMDWNRNLA
ncbi:MATE family efflux transporter [Pseudoflavonifractor sp. An44]|uniref:MATE family efflux transporter n=2 Tax=Pseudoflavonifractor TaxID=1017280 RepID=UPI000B56EC08|nr:MATE family efflux transporter [Pseudoflavonifractor sp. An44]OUP43379.1 MATE family efflux transporter [Pseudoflavonifractor sp. An187]